MATVTNLKQENFFPVCPLCESKLVLRAHEHRAVCTSDSCLLHNLSIPREIADAFNAVKISAARNGYQRAMEDVIRVAEKGVLT